MVTYQMETSPGQLKPIVFQIHQKLQEKNNAKKQQQA